MDSTHIFGKPVIRYSKTVLEYEQSNSNIITRKKILQKYQILAKLKVMVCPDSVFENGIRPRDLAELLDMPQATVRKFLREYVKEGILLVNVVSGCSSFYRPV